MMCEGYVGDVGDVDDVDDVGGRTGAESVSRRGI